ncbi:hypothetical protein BC833DRAFT_591992 [Globomyces pollinis-pini]|nr:hypothetical protein BC833DRAFT_591992 [Globomyces pollinis-pini]
MPNLLKTILFGHQFVLSARILNSQWLNTGYCDSPPNAMYVFDIANIKAKTPQKGETWSSLYQQFASENPIGTCGAQYEKSTSGCCVNLLTNTNGWKSGSPTLLNSNDTSYEKSLYEYAIKQTYCNVKPNNGILFNGFVDVFILADESCIDGYYQCSLNGYFNVFENEGCKGQVSPYQLTTQPLDLTHLQLGTFTASLKTFSAADGNIKVDWVVYYPLKNQIPFQPPNDKFIAWDIWLIVQLSLTVIFFGLGVVFGIIKYRQKPSTYFKILIVSQSLWLALSIENLIAINYVFSSKDAAILEAIAYSYLYGISTLSSVFLTTWLFNSTGKSFMPKWMIYPITISLLICHAVFNGAVYFDFCRLSYVGQALSFCSSSFYINWRSLYYYWIPIVFIWDVVPVMMLIWYTIYLHFHKITNPWKRLLKIWELDKLLIGMVVLQIWIAIFYFVYSDYLKFNQFMDGDKQANSLSRGRPLIRAIHFNLNIILLQRFHKFFKHAVKCDQNDSWVLKSQTAKIDQTNHIS